MGSPGTSIRSILPYATLPEALVQAQHDGRMEKWSTELLTGCSDAGAPHLHRSSFITALDSQRCRDSQWCCHGNLASGYPTVGPAA